MARVFDSGLRVPQRTAIRTAIVAALAGLRRDAGQYLFDVVELPWPITWSDESAEVQHWLDTVRGRSPVAAVALGGRDWQSAGVAALSWRGQLEVSVYLASNHRRSQLARVSGDAVAEGDHQQDPGLETIAEQVFERLAGIEVVAAGRQSLIPVRERWAWVGEDWTILELAFELAVTTTVNPNRGELTVHASLDARHSDDSADPVELQAVSEVPT